MGLLIGLSRIYLGVHYPSDVVVGAIFGFAIGMFVYAVIKKNLLKFSIQLFLPSEDYTAYLIKWGVLYYWNDEI